ncbi:hypothetical protein [Flavobacterium sp.]|uniref:hypothetical protein n=1 Tax=Flavobacterium sp. TaxID=239 RepID=UPI003D096AC9
MNLEKLNLVELNAQEAQEIQGGYWWVLAEVAYELIYAQDDVKKGYNAAKNLMK